MAAAHGKTGDGAGLRLRDDAVVLLDERDDFLAEAHDIAVHHAVALGFAHVLHGVAVELLLLDRDVEGLGGLLVAVAVRHDDDHRLGEALLDEVVEDLGGAAHGGPGLFVTTCTVEQIEHRIFLLGVVLVAVRSIDSQTAVDAEDLAVIPRVADGTALVGFDIVLGTLARNDEHVEETGTVALDLDVLRVIDGDAVHDKIIGVNLRGRERNLDFPDIVGATAHVDGAAVRDGHPVSAELEDGGVVGLEPAGHAVALDLRRDDGSLATEGEIVEFLRHGGQGQRSSCCDHKQSFHTI